MLEARARVVGMTKQGRRMLLILGTRRFGQPDQETLSVIDVETDLKRINCMIDRGLDATSWADIVREERPSRYLPRSGE